MSEPQAMDPGWLKYHPNPSKPEFQLPLGAVDAHCHVFGPSYEFPFAPERKYTPCNAGKEKLFALRDFLRIFPQCDSASHLSWTRQPCHG